MTKVAIGKHENKTVSLDVDSLLATRLLVQANSGKGKSHLLRRIAEQLFGKIQVIIIDPEGEFATLREKYGYVLVGKGGETPADPRSAALVAHKLLELRASAVCDLYEMKPATRHEWVKKFLDAMIDAPKNLWHPCVVIVDEAHVFCPEKGAGESEASDAMIGLATRGRKRGFACVFATQRLGKLRKDAAAELLNIMVGGTFIDIDRKRAADALGVYGADLHKFFDEIKVMERGYFFALGPAISVDRVLVHVGEVETTHPEAGSAKHGAEPPPPPEAIAKLLPKLADLPKTAEEKARTEAEYKTQIRSLKAQLVAAMQVRQQPIEKVDIKKIQATVKEAQIQLLREIDTRDKTIRKLLTGLGAIAKDAAALAGVKLPPIKLKEVPFDTKTVSRSIRIDYQTRKEIGPYPTQHGEVRIPASVERQGAKNGDAKLRSGAERMLAALAMWAPNGMTEGQMRAHAGLKKSGTFSAYLSDLRKGYIEERGGLVFATQEGLDYCQHIPPAPQTTEEVLAIWSPKLRDGARRMLLALVGKGGQPITKEELGEIAGLQKSGTFSAYLSDLKTARLVVVNRDGTVAANSETLFL